MAKIIALDIGGKRTGIAETDQLQMIASPLVTVSTELLLEHLRKMAEQDVFEAIVIGDPLALDGTDSHNSERVREWEKKLKEAFPAIPVVPEDERFSSKLAMQAMIQGGMKKMKRRKKGETDKVSAAIILESYLRRRG